MDEAAQIEQAIALSLADAGSATAGTEDVRIEIAEGDATAPLAQCVHCCGPLGSQSRFGACGAHSPGVVTCMSVESQYINTVASRSRFTCCTVAFVALNGRITMSPPRYCSYALGQSGESSIGAKTW